MKFAIEQTFVGQSLLFGFKVNPTVLKKSLSQLPQRQVLLSDVVCDSLSTGLHTVNSSAPKLMNDLIAVQIAHHRKPDQDFRTVIDSLSEIVRFVDEKCKAQVLFNKENLKDAVSHLFYRGLASFANQTDQSFLPLLEERSGTESLCSDSSISSGSELSSIRLSCDSSIQEIKNKLIKDGSLVNITNVNNEYEMSSFVSLKKESAEISTNLLMKSMISNYVVETDQQGNASCLRRSKRISEKRRNESNASFHTNESEKTDDIPQSKERERRGRCDKKLNNVSWCTRKHNLIAQKAVFQHDILPSRATCIFTSTASCLSACSNSGNEIQNSLHQRSCESGNRQMKSKSSTQKCEKLEASLLSTNEDNPKRVLRSSLNQDLSKKEIRVVNGIGFEKSSNLLNLHYDSSPQSEPISQNASHLRSVSKSCPSTLNSMEITKNIPTQLDLLLTNTSCFNGLFMHNHTDRLEQNEKPIYEIQGNVEEFPESENLSAFLNAGQLNSATYETELGHLKRYHFDEMKDNKILRPEQLSQNVGYLSQEDKVSISNRKRHGSEDKDMVLRQLDHVSFSNITYRRKSKQKRKNSKLQVKLDETNLIGQTAMKEGCQSQTQRCEASDMLAAPESEDIYVFLGGVGLDLQETPNSITSIENAKHENKETRPSIEKERDCFASTPSEYGNESNHTSSIESQVKISEPPLTSFVEGMKCDFEHVSKDYSERYSTDSKRNDMLPAEITPSNMLSLEKDQITTDIIYGDNITVDSRIFYLSESVVEDNSNCIMGQGVAPFNPRLENCTQLPMNARKILENSTKDSNPVNTKTSLSNRLSGTAQGSPEQDASFDLFEDSYTTSNGSSEQCLGALHNHDSDETECTHSYRRTSAVNNERPCLETCESYQGPSLSFRSPIIGHQRVKFNKRQKEIIFHDFEIISHLPVPSPQTKTLMSCLKKEPIPQQTNSSNGCSQDLFDSQLQASSSISKSLEGEVNIFSQNQSSTNNDLESWYIKSTKNILDPAALSIFQNSINGSQDMFSSCDTDSSESSRTEVNCLVTTNSLQKKRHSESSTIADFSHRFTSKKHGSPTAIQTTNGQMLSSKTRSSTSKSRDIQRASLDLFSPSFSQKTCERIPTSSFHHSLDPSPTLRFQKGRKPETPDLFSADSD